MELCPECQPLAQEERGPLGSQPWRVCSLTNGVRLIEQIDELLEEQRIDSQTALRLMLLTNKELLERMSGCEEKTREHEAYIKGYPSVLWLWSNRRKETILVIVLVFLLLYFLMSPITISDIRHALLELFGLPADLGLGP